VKRSLLENTQGIQVAILLVAIQAVPHHKTFFNAEAAVVHCHMLVSPRGLVDECGDFQASRVCFLDPLPVLAEGQSRVDNIIHQNDIFVPYLRLHVHEDFELPTADGSRSIRGDSCKIDFAGNGEVPNEIREENEGTFQYADQEQIPLGVIRRDLRRELFDTGTDRVRVKKGSLDLLHAILQDLVGLHARPETRIAVAISPLFIDLIFGTGR